MCTVIDALIIQTRGDDIKCEAGGPDKKTGKYAGWIVLYRGEEYDHALLSTDPVFNSAAEAVAHMEGLVKQIRSLELINSAARDGQS